MQVKKKTQGSFSKQAFVSVATYSEVKNELKKKVKSQGVSISKYIESLILNDLRKDGISITVKAEKKLI